MPQESSSSSSSSESSDDSSLPSQSSQFSDDSSLSSQSSQSSDDSSLSSHSSQSSDESSLSSQSSQSSDESSLSSQSSQSSDESSLSSQSSQSSDDSSLSSQSSQSSDDSSLSSQSSASSDDSSLSSQSSASSDDSSLSSQSSASSDDSSQSSDLQTTDSSSAECEGKKFIPSIGLAYPPLVIFPIAPGQDSSTTVEEPLPPEPEAEVLCDGDNDVWRARLKKLDLNFSMRISESTKLLTIDQIAAADCLLLDEMKDDVEYIRTHVRGSGVHGPYWLPEGFSRAHEDVHLLLLQQGIAFLHLTLVQELEAITRPCVDFSQKDAQAHMKDEMDAAVARFQDGFGQLYLDQVAHIPAATFLSVHDAFLAPWAARVHDAGVLLDCWPP